ncbi:alpha/beta hydrolase [Thalassotalea insulae]|uniref:Alpha/beta hydrolase n=1 Tax=Thalassotalea insulae TaxID=2056778 RepID=A0ABQ6H0K6_9GAMM|nr:alpha/beta family hydrolase [Thalassotalea insulae]GLX79971.1 alpha/beta hydrolase [Thalassotalea insulae]
MTTPSLLKKEVNNARAYVVFAHGAGADKDSEFIEQISIRLNQRAINVLCFNFYYMDKRLLDGKRYPPDRMPKLLSCFEQVLTQVTTELPIFLMGKSMGGRVAATIAGQVLKGVKGVICLGYPFHPQKQPQKLRLEPLQQTQLPVLVVQGDRDALGCRAEIADYQLSELCQINFLPDGDHDLKPRKKSGFSHQAHLDSAVDMIESFINEQR